MNKKTSWIQALALDALMKRWKMMEIAAAGKHEIET